MELHKIYSFLKNQEWRVLEIWRTWTLELEVLSKRFQILEQESEVLSNFKILLELGTGKLEQSEEFHYKIVEEKCRWFQKGGGPRSIAKLPNEQLLNYRHSLRIVGWDAKGGREIGMSAAISLHFYWRNFLQKENKIKIRMHFLFRVSIHIRSQKT